VRDDDKLLLFRNLVLKTKHARMPVALKSGRTCFASCSLEYVLAKFHLSPKSSESVSSEEEIEESGKDVHLSIFEPSPK
jgi:hypothetical protein